MTTIAGRAVVQTGVQDNTKKGVKAIEGRFKNLSAKLNKLSRQAAKYSAAIGAPLLLAARQFGQTGDKIDKFAQRTKLSTDSVQSLGFAMEQSGASLEQLEPALRRVSKSVLDLSRASEGSPIAKDFALMGIALEDIQNAKPGDQFRMILKGLQGIGDDSTRMGVAMNVLGRSGTQLLPLLGNLEALEKEFDTLGDKMSNQQVKDAAAMNDAFNKLQRQFKAIVVQVGAAIGPALTELANQIGPLVKMVIDWVRNNKDWVITAGKVAVALGGVSVALKAISLAMSTNPFVLIATGVATALPLLGQLNKSLGLTKDQLNGVGGAFGPKSAIGHGGSGDPFKGRTDLTANDPRHIARKNFMKLDGYHSAIRGAGLGAGIPGSANASASSRSGAYRSMLGDLTTSIKSLAENTKNTIGQGANLVGNSLNLASTFGQMQAIGPLLQSTAGGLGGSALGFGSQMGAASPAEQQVQLQEQMAESLDAINGNIEGLRNEGIANG